MCEPINCIFYEQVWLNYYKPWVEIDNGYNICKLAGSTKDTKRIFTQEHIEKIRNANIGKKQTNEHVEKTKKRLKGNTYNLNHKWSEEQKIKIRSQCKNKKSIERIDMQTGEIKEYDSVNEAVRDGFHCYRNHAKFKNQWNS